MASAKLLVNYYYPNGKRLNERIGCVTIEKEAFVMHLREKISLALDTDIPMELFKVSFDWDDISLGTTAEPNRLSLPNLIRVVEAPEEPLSVILGLEKALSVQHITGPRRFKHCSILVVPASHVRSLLDQPCNSLISCKSTA